MKFIILLTIFLGFITNQMNAVEFKDCGSTEGSFSQIIVSECDTTKSVCILKRNTNATITIEFDSKTESQNLTAIVHGIIMGIEMPFQLPNPDGCNSGVTCPLQNRSSYSYVATLPVLKHYPKVKVDVKWQLKDDLNQDIVCVIIPAKIE